MDQLRRSCVANRADVPDLILVDFKGKPFTACGRFSCKIYILRFSNSVLMIKLLGIVAVLEKYKSSDNDSLREASKFALLEINEETITPTKAVDEGASAPPPTYTQAVAEGMESNMSGHVMISYQWDSQERAVYVRDKLRENGYNVWLDLDEMSKFRSILFLTNFIH